MRTHSTREPERPLNPPDHGDHDDRYCAQCGEFRPISWIPVDAVYDEPLCNSCIAQREAENIRADERTW